MKFFRILIGVYFVAVSVECAFSQTVLLQSEDQTIFLPESSDFEEASYYNYGSSIFNTQRPLWSDRSLQRKLNLTTGQRRDLMNIKIEYEDSIEELEDELSELRSKGFNQNVRGRLKEIKMEIASRKKEFLEEADKLLKSPQRKQKQMLLVARSLSSGFIHKMTSGSFDSVIGISKKQKKRIAKIKTKLDEKMISLLQETKQSLLEELDPKQRKVFLKTLENYEYRTGKNGIAYVESAYFKKRRKSTKK